MKVKYRLINWSNRYGTFNIPPTFLSSLHAHSHTSRRGTSSPNLSPRPVSARPQRPVRKCLAVCAHINAFVVIHSRKQMHTVTEGRSWLQFFDYHCQSKSSCSAANTQQFYSTINLYVIYFGGFMATLRNNNISLHYTFTPA